MSDTIVTAEWVDVGNYGSALTNNRKHARSWISLRVRRNDRHIQFQSRQSRLWRIVRFAGLATHHPLEFVAALSQGAARLQRGGA
jgi:hypothetical protein